jgi:hypothetical protein
MGWVRIPHPAFISVLCAVVVGAGLLWQPGETWAGLLTAAIYGLALVLGGALFAAIQITGGAKWWHDLRASCIALTKMMPVPAIVLVVTLLGGLQILYPWARPGAADASHLLHEKVSWLNVPFFYARSIVVLAVWFGAGAALAARLKASMEKPSAESHTNLVKIAPIYILIFAFSISVASWDWIMSLEPEWFSTMFGVYGFAGIFQGVVAVLIVMVLLRDRHSGYANVSKSLLHDLGKYLFAFSLFWAYIWFCQFMLIWYANLPEETFYFTTRLESGWSALFLLNPILNFALPFLLLLSERMKKKPTVMLQVALVVLAGRWLDIHLMIAPALGESPRVPWVGLVATVGVLVGMVSLYKRASGEME